jgi:hypothetical protein
MLRADTLGERPRQLGRCGAADDHHGGPARQAGTQAGVGPVLADHDQRR